MGGDRMDGRLMAGGLMDGRLMGGDLMAGDLIGRVRSAGRPPEGRDSGPIGGWSDRRNWWGACPADGGLAAAAHDDLVSDHRGQPAIT
jgi:hypothetical protein